MSRRIGRGTPKRLLACESAAVVPAPEELHDALRGWLRSIIRQLAEDHQSRTTKCVSSRDVVLVSSRDVVLAIQRSVGVTTHAFVAAAQHPKASQ